MKEKNNTDVVYALADYKQLVMAYKTKYAQLLKVSVFWKISFVWLGVFLACVSCALFFLFNDAKNQLTQKDKAIDHLNIRIESISAELAGLAKDLASAQAEIRDKDKMIRGMEKNMSTNSKKLLEKLLKSPDRPDNNTSVTRAK
ncbi:MAG: hypothetical protein PHH68_06545 [Candidatus Omnitrophica bacterium]|jgi:septal ring factor EnvC (AmiA/AmiB activator)|nr:hypothetical protein [Candidatus Omnitrophota bacterium]MDD5079963.1 hypothetical protein [Candidatus Omnitrophota bacterium]MDD5775885.1 hypothetical protein [Candidatus Omnitrophota bacterium]